MVGEGEKQKLWGNRYPKKQKQQHMSNPGEYLPIASQQRGPGDA